MVVDRGDKRCLIGLTGRTVGRCLRANRGVAGNRSCPVRLSRGLKMFMALGGGGSLEKYVKCTRPVVDTVRTAVSMTVTTTIGSPEFPRIDLSRLSAVSLRMAMLAGPRVVLMTRCSRCFSRVRVNDSNLVVRGNCSEKLLLPRMTARGGFDVRSFLRRAYVGTKVDTSD